MALPFLPEEQIIPVFDTLKEQATTHMQPLVQYVEDTWILSTVFKPSNWCVFMQRIRTNNDLEGYHRRLNSKAADKGNLQLYVLIPLLYTESRTVRLHVRLISERKLRRHQRTQHRKLQGKIFEIWRRYQDNEISTSQLLRAVSHLNGPVSG